MPAYSHDLLIDQATGEIDPVYLAQGAEILARSCYGAYCTDRDVAYCLEKLTGIAQIFRQRWREAHGLPDDQTYTMVDAYGRDVQGVRWSAF